MFSLPIAISNSSIQYISEPWRVINFQAYYTLHSIPNNNKQHKSLKKNHLVCDFVGLQ